MFHSKKSNNRVNKIHERALRLVYKDYTSSFDDLLAKDNSFKIHQRNLQKLAIEIFKVKKGIAPAIMNNIFKFNDNTYSVRKDTAYFKSRNVGRDRDSLFCRIEDLEQYSFGNKGINITSDF